MKSVSLIFIGLTILGIGICQNTNDEINLLLQVKEEDSKELVSNYLLTILEGDNFNDTLLQAVHQITVEGDTILNLKITPGSYQLQIRSHPCKPFTDTLTVPATVKNNQLIKTIYLEGCHFGDW